MSGFDDSWLDEGGGGGDGEGYGTVYRYIVRVEREGGIYSVIAMGYGLTLPPPARNVSPPRDRKRGEERSGWVEGRR